MTRTLRARQSIEIALFLYLLFGLVALACSAPIQTYPGARRPRSETARIDIGDLEPPIKVDGGVIPGKAAEVMPGPHRISGYGRVKGARYKVAASFTAAAGNAYAAHVFWTAKRRDPDDVAPRADRLVEVTPVLLIENADRSSEGYRIVAKDGSANACNALEAREEECPDAL